MPTIMPATNVPLATTGKTHLGGGGSTVRSNASAVMVRTLSASRSALHVAKNSRASARHFGRSTREQPTASRLALAALPCAEMYERSFMHRDHVTHIVCTSTDFVVTASRDGQVKFWKKMQKGVEFVKHYKAHLKAINALVVSHDGQRACTTSQPSPTLRITPARYTVRRWCT